MTDPQYRQRWLAMLAKLCCPLDPVAAATALSAMLPLLADVPEDAFTEPSLRHVAKLAKRPPSYAELRGWLDDWWNDNRPPMPALPDNVADLTPIERNWMAYWHQREREGFVPLRGPDGRLLRPEVTDWRAHTESVIRRHAPRVLDRVAQG